MLKLGVMEEQKMVDKTKCIGCGTCVAICPVGAISFDENGQAKIDKTKCIRCGSCQASCPVEAIDLSRSDNGKDSNN